METPGIRASSFLKQMKQIIECVPNYSEGRDRSVIDRIVAAIAAVKGVKVLDVDPGEATNRTVVTFVGEPAEVCEAAFRGAAKAQELIDMRQHHGAHPRSGATDVLPLIPVSGITLEECAALARKLAERMATELGIPCYCYEAAAFKPERKNLAVCRAGEYEALPEKMADPARKPDFGPDSYNDVVARSGASNVGARNFLVAVNFNLNTTSTRRAMAVAFDVREKGRKAREGGSLTGKLLKDENGEQIWIPGTLKGCKAIGWYIDEYGIAQVSMNITDIDVTPLHIAYEEVCRAAAARGLKVTGTEIVGLVPKRVLMEAGRFYLEKQQRSLGISDDEIMKIAVKSMSLDDLKPFDPKEKVIEFLMQDEAEEAIKHRLVRLTADGFASETASESPAPGGGSVSAYMGALGAALGTMVANLSSHKRGWDSRWKEFSDVAEKGQSIMQQLLDLVDEDTAAFDRIMACFSMPKGTEEEKSARAAALEDATLYAAQVPLRTMETSLQALPLALEMALKGNPASASDAGVAALAATAAVRGAELNVRINAAGLQDKSAAMPLIARAAEIVKQAQQLEAEVLKAVNQNIDK
ncbi:MAG: glutamate formimidoyltransferase [Bacteroidales bacterium]|nr:glutamate formimidoyltransferase [Bacteroidales bacterium]